MPATILLSLFWFFHFAGLGIFFPFFSLYLHENAGLVGHQVGIVQAVFPAVALVAQPLWGQLADRTGARTRVLTWVTLAGSFGYAGMALATGFASLLATATLMAVFATAIVPASVAVSMGTLRQRGAYSFGQVRVWGTVGFLCAILGFPRFLDRLQASGGLTAVAGGPSEPGLRVMFPTAAAFVLLAAVVAAFLPRDGAVALRAGRGDWRQLTSCTPLVRLLLFAFGAFFCLQGPMVLFPILIRARGGDIDTVGGMWVLMLLVEIPLVLGSGAGVRRFGPKGLLIGGLFCGGLRWALSALVQDLTWIYPLQVLHGAFVAGVLLGGPIYLEAIVPEHLRSTGQSLLVMCGIGAGGILSAITAGALLERTGPDVPYLGGGITAMALAVSALWWLPRPPEPGATSATGP